MEVHRETGALGSPGEGFSVLFGPRPHRHRLYRAYCVSAGPLRFDRRNVDRRDGRCRAQGNGDRDEHVHRVVPAGHHGRRRLLFDSQPAGGHLRPVGQRQRVQAVHPDRRHHSINAVTRVDITVQVGAVTEQVTVEASSAVSPDDEVGCQHDLDTQAIENLPLSGYRNYQTLINLVPGATPAGIRTPSPIRRDALDDQRQRPGRGANNTRVDGSADILVTMPHHAVYVPPVESIQEVNISTNNFDAEQGMTGGAAVTVITKSGTNEFRGSAFAMHDNSALADFHVGRESRRASRRSRKSTRNIDGANLGGPIKKNKLFFFGNWEGTFERVSHSDAVFRPDR